MSLRALSCNLLSGRACAGALTDLINDHSVDVVCAQELSQELASAITATLPYGDMSHNQIHKGNGIASRYPVEMKRIELPKRDAWVAKLSPRQWPNLPFAIEIVNVHISGPHLWPYFPHPVRRSSQLNALLDYRQRKEEVPHAVFGDFNSTPIWPVYKKMAQRYIDGALGSDNVKRSIGGTWPYLPALGVKGWLRIDHCFLWKLAAKRIQKVEIPGSDHLGLLVDLRVP